MFRILIYELSQGLKVSNDILKVSNDILKVSNDILKEIF